METAYINNEAKNFYQEINSILKGFKPQTLQKKKAPQRWSEYYEKHFALQGGIGNDGVEEWIMYVHTAEPYTVPPNYVDIEMSTSKLKNGKQLDMIKSWLN